MFEVDVKNVMEGRGGGGGGEDQARFFTRISSTKLPEVISISSS